MKFFTIATLFGFAALAIAAPTPDPAECGCDEVAHPPVPAPIPAPAPVPTPAPSVAPAPAPAPEPESTPESMPTMPAPVHHDEPVPSNSYAQGCNQVGGSAYCCNQVTPGSQYGGLIPIDLNVLLQCK